MHIGTLSVALSKRRKKPTTPVAFAIAALLIGAGCSLDEDPGGEDPGDPDAGDSAPGDIEPQAAVAPILNSYDPNQKGTFQTTIEASWGSWAILEDGWQVWNGIVTAGNPACDATDITSGCAYPPSGKAGAGAAYQNTPKYSEEDNPFSHDGRDLNISFLPTTDWTRSVVNTNVSIPQQSVVLDIEVEAQYFWPTVNWWNDKYDGAVFREGLTVGSNPYREAWNLSTPHPGDQIVVSGLHVRDGSHSPDPAEVHPPQAMSWLKKVGPHDYDLTFNAASHSYRPFESARANLPGAWYWFRIGDFDPNLTMQVTYAGDNWIVDPLSSYTSFSGYQAVRNCNDSGTAPDATFAGGVPCRAQLGSNRLVSDFFSHSTWSGGSMAGAGYAGVYLASNSGTENSGGLPVLASGTYRVCQPEASNNYCAPRLPGFKQVSHGLPKTLHVNLKNYNSGLWADFRNNNATSGEQLQQYPYTGGNNQRFNIMYKGADATGPYFTIQNYNGKCFDTYSGTNNGQPVYQEYCYGDAWQRWRFVPTYGNGGTFGFNIKNVQSGRCIGIAGGTQNSGEGAILWDCVGQPDTVWTIAEQL